METKAILIVEDDPDDQEFIKAALETCGLAGRAVFFSDGVAALSALSRPEQVPPGLIVLDLMLPMLSGLEVLERVRADPRLASVPVVLFSSSDRPDDVDRAYRLGANSYVRKPVEPAEFTAAVCELARYWTARNIPARRAS